MLFAGEKQKRIVQFAYALLFLVAAGLRFYDLGDIQKPVFDEVYFPKFAYSYIENKPFFHTHPPFAKYLMKFGIQSYYAMPWTEDIQFGQVAFKELNPVSYRWVNALLGCLFTLVIARIMYLLSRSHLLALLAMCFVATDGTMIVASRYGLSNLHVIFWGFLSLWALLEALIRKKVFYFYPIAAVLLGLTIGVKWNGLSFWVIAMVIIIAVFIMSRFKLNMVPGIYVVSDILENVRKLKLSMRLLILAGFVVLPLAVYSLLWVPDLKLNTRYDFQQTHTQIFNYHNASVKDGDHPYCSRWYTWPCMLRPISYHFEKIPAKAIAGQKQVFKNVHAFGNPFLYWSSALAVIFLTGVVCRDLWYLLRYRQVSDEFYLRVFIAMGFYASWLPWMLVSRCTFIYHYQSAAVFSFLALAWFTMRAIQYGRSGRVLSLILGIALLFSFVYWLPFQLGIELSRDAFYNRMWFTSWI